MSVTEKINAQRAKIDASDTPPSEEITRRRNTADKILEASGATQACQDIHDQFWAFGSLTRCDMERRPRKFGEAAPVVGQFIMVRSGASGSAEGYDGYQIFVGADAQTGEIVIYSGQRPISISPTAEGWTPERQEIVEQAIAEAFNNPGTFYWYEGMYGEEFVYNHTLPETR